MSITPFKVEVSDDAIADLKERLTMARWPHATTTDWSRGQPVAFIIVTTLLLLGAPFLGIKWGFPDDRVLPQSASAREVGDELRTDFAVDSSTNVAVVIPDATGVTPAELDRYASALSEVVDVSSAGKPHPAPKALYFTVNDLDAVFARAKALGCLSAEDVHGVSGSAISVRPWGERSFYVQDQWQNPLCFVEAGTVYPG